MNFANRRPARTVDFSEARSAVSLLFFFEHFVNAEPKPHSGSIRFGHCPACGPSSAASLKVSVLGEKWNCFSCNERGDVVEAAAHLWGMSLKDAAMQLVGADPEVMNSYVPPTAKPAVDRDDQAMQEAIAKLIENTAGPTDTALNYFLGRGISAETVKEAVSRGMLVTLPDNPEEIKTHLLDVVGRDALIATGLWKADAKAPAAAFRPLMFISHLGKAAEFRVMRLTEPNENKSLRYGDIQPWIWKNEDEDRVTMTEGCLDLLAAVSMGTKRTLMGLPGCQNWKPEWFEGLKDRHVLTAFDADGPGRIATEKLGAVLKSTGANVFQHDLPGEAKDVNEQLILQGPHCRLEFFDAEGDKAPVRKALLSLPGCDRWKPSQFAQIQGRHIVIRPGGRKRNQEALERLCSVFKRGGATFSVQQR